MTHYNIEIVSDTVCPWCYVGKNRLDAAIATHKQQHPSDTFTTEWKPYFLNPDAPIPGIDKQTHYERKFGAQRTQMMQTHLSRLGAQVGINFAFGGTTGNTRDSHRLITLARAHGEAAQTRVVEELFKSYFEANEDITDKGVLLAAAMRAGLQESEARGWLESDEGGAEVEREVLHAKQFIGGVPNFTIQCKFEVQGAEEPAAFLRIFEQVAKLEGAKAKTLGGTGSNGMMQGVVGSVQNC